MSIRNDSLAPAPSRPVGCPARAGQPPGCRWCFSVVERLEAIGRKALILESHRAGQVGKAYLANDKLDAAKVARIHLSGLSPTVWKPDATTRGRRELFFHLPALRERGQPLKQPMPMHHRFRNPTPDDGVEGHCLGRFASLENKDGRLQVAPLH
ncbi:MAG TPA: hypothetical protein VIT91_08230 [Chthoniobacterales bacterium]